MRRYNAFGNRGISCFGHCIWFMASFVDNVSRMRNGMFNNILSNSEEKRVKEKIMWHYNDVRRRNILDNWFCVGILASRVDCVSGRRNNLCDNKLNYGRKRR